MEPTKTPSLFPLETCPQVSDEAFALFHSIDRELYTRLIQNLGRDPAESMQVVAFLMWLERQSSDMNLIKRMLSLPPMLLNEMADEAAKCLKCAENDMYPIADMNPGPELTFLPEFMNNPVVSLRFFHQNRIAVLRGVSKIVNTVCVRAFSDILQRSAATGGRVPLVNDVGESSRLAERNDIGGGEVAAPPQPQAPPVVLYNPHLSFPFLPLAPGTGTGLGPLNQMPLPPPLGHHAPAVQHAIGVPVHLAAVEGFPMYDLEVQRQMLGNQLGEMLGRNLVINNREEIANVNYGEEVEERVGEEEVPPDDRTIFLTFSKGYPITEAEVREFFTKRFGDFIEDLIMQDVGVNEQPLFARMVARSTSVIDGIVGGNKAKYSINGKHVWARKYVKKQTPRSPPRVSESSSSI